MRFDAMGGRRLPAEVTPNLNRLLAGGTEFTRCFCQNGVCMPSRASFMTGQYPPQTGVTQNGYDLPDDCPVVASRLMKAAGYQTAHFGKLHLQPHQEYDLDPKSRNRYGFDVFHPSEARCGYEDAWRIWLRDRYPESVKAFAADRSTVAPPPDAPVGWVVDAPWQASHCAWVVQAACDHLKSPYCSRVERAQFLHLGFHHPHPPLNPTRSSYDRVKDLELTPREVRGDEQADKPRRLQGMLAQYADWTEEELEDYLRSYAAMVAEVDASVGLLVDFLERENQLDDTLLVFTADHGDMCGDHHMVSKGQHFYDAVMQVPLLMHWPAGLGGERREIGGLVEMVDLLPTTLGLCGAAVPQHLSGTNWAPSLPGDGGAVGKGGVFAYSSPGMAMVRTEDAKLIRYAGEGGGDVLYDLRQDPGERVNVADNPGYARLHAEMRTRLLDRLLTGCVSGQELIHPF
jgi:arylsulfatase A-like enzyme